MARSETNNERKARGAKILWTIILLCILGGAVTGLWFFMKGDAKHIEHQEQVDGPSDRV
ncbi:MAG: hypothetical protein J1E99_05535 [Muribaculaceae bacterium]|nr:hypothetical protein [Muribaculaceae bacterium]